MIFPLDLGIYLAKRMCSRMQLRYADKIEIFSEKDQHISSTLSAKWNDVNVVQHIASQTLNIELCANETPVCFIRLRWNFSEAEKRSEIRVYGDEWLGRAFVRIAVCPGCAQYQTVPTGARKRQDALRNALA